MIFLQSAAVARGHPAAENEDEVIKQCLNINDDANPDVSFQEQNANISLYEVNN